MEAKKYYGVTKNKGVGFMISNVSFVVVAKNEEFGIDKCLASLSKMQLNDCEIRGKYFYQRGKSDTKYLLKLVIVSPSYPQGNDRFNSLKYYL